MPAISADALVAVAEDGELAGIDAGRAIFAGLVDAQHRRHVGTRVAGAPGGRQARRGSFLRLSHRITNAADERKDRIPSRHRNAEPRPLDLVAADHRRGHDRLQEIIGRAAGGGRGALGEALEIIELDAGMIEADRAARPRSPAPRARPAARPPRDEERAGARRRAPPYGRNAATSTSRTDRARPRYWNANAPASNAAGTSRASALARPSGLPHR